MYTERKSWIDIIRGICILLVVMGHLSESHIFHIFANQIKMPMFYVVAGLFIKPDKKAFKFIKDSAFRLFIPWIIFSFVWLKVPFFLITKGFVKAYDTFLSCTFTGGFWFIPSFFITQVIFMAINKICRNNKIGLSIACCICFIISHFAGKVEFLKIITVNTALSGILFILIGYLIRDLKCNVDKIKFQHAIYSAVTYLILCFIGCIVKPNATLDFHKVKYGNLPLNLAMIFVGIAASITISVCLNRKYKMTALSTLGKNTLLVYLLSATISGAIIKPFTSIGIPIGQIAKTNIFMAFILAVIVCTLCTLISEFFSRKAPWIVGLKRPH